MNVLLFFVHQCILLSTLCWVLTTVHLQILKKYKLSHSLRTVDNLYFVIKREIQKKKNNKKTSQNKQTNPRANFEQTHERTLNNVTMKIYFSGKELERGNLGLFVHLTLSLSAFIIVVLVCVLLRMAYRYDWFWSQCIHNNLLWLYKFIFKENVISTSVFRLTIIVQVD